MSTVSGAAIKGKRRAAESHRALENSSKSSSKKGSKGGNRLLGCLLDEPENLLAAFGSKFFADFWRTIMLTGCDEEEVKEVFFDFFLPTITVTLGGQQLFGNLEELVAAQAPLFTGACMRGEVMAWVATSAKAVDCNTMTVFMNELAFDGASPPAPITGEGLPSGREYTLYVEDTGELFLMEANPVCPFEMGVIECQAMPTV